MSKQANKTLIGAFVVGAVALVVAGVLVFGSGTFLTERHTFVMYFDGSVSGLNVGSPVVFRGVKIGTVTDVILRADPADMSIQIPVFIEIEPHRFERVGKGVQKRDVETAVQLLVDRGLRARLELQSLVTGQLMIELDLHPDKPMKLVGTAYESQEIPTIPSSWDELTTTLKKLPLEQLVTNLTSAIEGIERAVNSPEVGRGMRNMNETLEDMQKLIEDLDRSFAENAELPYYFTKAMEELSAAARSVRVLADYLEQNPDALLRGKGGLGGK
ncbi:MAG: MlaD family protein [Thermodesulfobacteriota bacterium]|nr:MlaD family protein [Thermodesulfobacteriota bacterium]